jgi:hypothetical protein
VLRKEREAIQQETTKEEERLRKEREIIQQEIAKEKEKLVEVEQRRNDEDLNGQEDVGERKKDRRVLPPPVSSFPPLVIFPYPVSSLQSPF